MKSAPVWVQGDLESKEEHEKSKSSNQLVKWISSSDKYIDSNNSYLSDYIHKFPVASILSQSLIEKYEELSKSFFLKFFSINQHPSYAK